MVVGNMYIFLFIINYSYIVIMIIIIYYNLLILDNNAEFNDIIQQSLL